LFLTERSEMDAFRGKAEEKWALVESMSKGTTLHVYRGRLQVEKIWDPNEMNEWRWVEEWRVIVTGLHYDVGLE